MNNELGEPDHPAADSELGIRLRYLRLARGLRMREVARRAGCSESMISKIETGHAAPSLRVLHKIAAVLETSIAALFEAGRANTIVQRAGARELMTLRKGGDGGRIILERVAPTSPDSRLEGNIHIVEPGAESDGAISHEGEELGYVLEGSIELTVDGERYYVQAGDSFVFASTQEHRYYNPGHVVARVLWINTPVTF